MGGGAGSIGGGGGLRGEVVLMRRHEGGRGLSVGGGGRCLGGGSGPGWGVVTIGESRDRGGLGDKGRHGEV